MNTPTKKGHIQSDPFRFNTLQKLYFQGDSGVGKSSLISQYVTKRFYNQHKTNMCADFLRKNITIDDRAVTLRIWDMPSQEPFRTEYVTSYRGADCCVLVYDLTDVTSFKNLENWKNEFLVHASPRDPEKFPFVLLGNKFDNEIIRAVHVKRVKEWCQSNCNMPYFEVSAKDELNLDEAFMEIAKAAIIADSHCNDSTFEKEIDKYLTPSPPPPNRLLAPSPPNRCLTPSPADSRSSNSDKGTCSQSLEISVEEEEENISTEGFENGGFNQNISEICVDSVEDVVKNYVPHPQKRYMAPRSCKRPLKNQQVKDKKRNKKKKVSPHKCIDDTEVNVVNETIVGIKLTENELVEKEVNGPAETEINENELEEEDVNGPLEANINENPLEEVVNGPNVRLSRPPISRSASQSSQRETSPQKFCKCKGNEDQGPHESSKCLKKLKKFAVLNENGAMVLPNHIENNQAFWSYDAFLDKQLDEEGI
uniref:Uncharacterized protein n=1 Tax=Meloidogyne enterolobii TaxID=390850 RepID=A0A6V7V5G1_MELEN|nr:unnamed protein product [Meloidogyne enterolobii]